MRIKQMIWIFALLLIVQSVLGIIAIQQLPVTQPNGIVIESPIFNYVKMNNNFSFYFNVYNLSSGLTLDNSSVTCSFTLYDRSEIVMQDNNAQSPVQVNGALFNHVGDFSRLIKCNSTSGYGDFNEFSFRVSNAEVETSSSEAIVLSMMLFIFLALFSMTIIGAFNIEEENYVEMGEKGEILKINYGKYLKLFLFLLSHLMIWIASFFAWQISDKMLAIPVVADILRWAFIIIGILIFPVIITITIIGFVKIFADVELEKKFRRGFRP